jgi:hypothetical protein
MRHNTIFYTTRQDLHCQTAGEGFASSPYVSLHAINAIIYVIRIPFLTYSPPVSLEMSCSPTKERALTRNVGRLSESPTRRVLLLVWLLRQLIHGSRNSRSDILQREHLAEITTRLNIHRHSAVAAKEAAGRMRDLSIQHCHRTILYLPTPFRQLFLI